jgi:hypothetical protein
VVVVTWVKLDDALAEDPRWDLIGPAGLGVHIAAMSFCSRNQTDGVLSRGRAEQLLMFEGAADVVTQLIKHGLWLERGTQVEIVGYLDDQPSAEDVEKVRELARARQRRQRQHRSGDHSLCDPGYCRAAERVTRDDPRDSRVSHTVSHATPTRPDPTHPDPTPREGEGMGGKAANARAPKGSLGAAAQGRTITLDAGPPSFRDLCEPHGREATTCPFCKAGES